MLDKLGGGAGGHKNWKARYFVLSDHLYYFQDQASFAKDPKNHLGRIALNAYFVSKVEDSTSFEFCVNAYPKSLECRANSAAEMDEWIKVLMNRACCFLRAVLCRCVGRCVGRRCDA